jgi:RNA polymerase sigma-70 factor (ECF subfamily)
MGLRAETTGTISDAEVIISSLTAPEMFGSVFDRHFVAVHRYLARRVGRERADDLASQTFTVAFARRASFRRDALDARPWLLGIATHLLLNDRRSEQRLLETMARLGAQAHVAMSHSDRQASEVDGELAAALAGLDGDQRDVLLLVAWGELSYEEIAEAMAIPVGTVRSRLSRARAHLRARLDVRRAVLPPAPNPESEEIR